MEVTIYNGDLCDRLSEIEADSIDAIVTDPPYHLTAGKRGGIGPASMNLASPAGRSRIGTGFMGMAWDGGDVAMRPETWAAVLRVAKPGAHLIAFGGTRTFHRIWCAIEDAGWEIRDTLMWLYGQGFPKSSNQSDDWQGWGTALKPAFEPIVLARKPLAGTVGENLQRYGVGALNIDGCRIPAGSDDLNGGAYSGELRRREEYSPTDGGTAVPLSRLNRGAGEYEQPDGRWPANVLHDGSDEVVEAFPDSDGAAAPVHRRGSDKFRTTYGSFKGHECEGDTAYRGDSGSAARFFWCPKASQSDRNDGLQGMPNHHPTVKPTELMQWLCRLVTTPGGTVLDPFMGSGSTGKAAVLEGMHFIGIELDRDYMEIARRRIESRDPLFTRAAVK